MIIGNPEQELFTRKNAPAEVLEPTGLARSRVNHIDKCALLRHTSPVPTCDDLIGC